MFRKEIKRLSCIALTALLLVPQTVHAQDSAITKQMEQTEKELSGDSELPETSGDTVEDEKSDETGVTNSDNNTGGETVQPDETPESPEPSEPEGEESESGEIRDPEVVDPNGESGETPGDMPEESDPAPEEPEQHQMHLQYRAHVQNIGWQPWVSDGEIAGTTGKAYRVEAIEMRVVDEEGNPYEGVTVQYRAHVQNIGWQPWVADGEIAGTSGRSLRVEAFQIQVLDTTGDEEKVYPVHYNTHVQDFGWLADAQDGEMAGSAGFGKRVEAVRISMGSVSEKQGRCFIRRYNNSELLAGAHVQNYGDMPISVENGILGTSGKGLRVEGLTITLDQSSGEVLTGGLEYGAHVQNVGWQPTVADGAFSGTRGQSLRIEAVNIRLTGEIAKYYDIYYRTHVQNIGWMGWAKNGQNAGTSGMAYRMEAIQLKLVYKGDAAPGQNRGYFQNMSSAIARIRTYAGRPYVWGGTTPNGWDCSGCMQWLYKNCLDISLPRNSREQGKMGTAVNMFDQSKWMPGDLLVFGGWNASHVGMYLGNGNMIHAINARRGTRIDNVYWYDRVDTELTLISVRRLL